MKNEIIKCEPESGESEDDFIGRCVGITMNNGTFDNSSQAAAYCHSQWNKAHGGKSMNKEILIKNASVTKSQKPDVYRIMASTEEIDSQDDITEAESFRNLDDWLTRQKGRILYDHPWVRGVTGEESLAVGKGIAGFKVPGTGLIIDFIFSPLPFAQKLKILADIDFPLFASIGGFVVDSVDEVIEGRKIRRIKNFQLIEISLCSVQANDSAGFIKNLKAAGMATINIEKVLSEIVEYDKVKAGLSEKDKMIGLADYHLKNKR